MSYLICLLWSRAVINRIFFAYTGSGSVSGSATLLYTRSAPLNNGIFQIRKRVEKKWEISLFLHKMCSPVLSYSYNMHFVSLPSVHYLFMYYRNMSDFFGNLKLFHFFNNNLNHRSNPHKIFSKIREKFIICHFFKTDSFRLAKLQTYIK